MGLNSISGGSGLGASASSLQSSSQKSSAASAASNAAVSLALGSGKSSKSDSYYMRQHSKLHAVKGKLSDDDRMELLGIFISAADVLKRGGTIDAEGMASKASYSLTESLRRNGVELKDALKGMFIIYQDGQSGRYSGDYSSLV